MLVTWELMLLLWLLFTNKTTPEEPVYYRLGTIFLDVLEGEEITSVI